MPLYTSLKDEVYVVGYGGYFYRKGHLHMGGG